MPDTHVHTAVLGAGITGLCAGHKLLRELGADAVIVLEASDRAGGYAQTETIDGYRCDWGPNGFLDKEPRMLEWVEELGLTSELVRANEAAARRFLLKKGKLVELLPPPKFLLSPLLSVAGRARLLCEPLIAPKRDAAPESIWHFAARRIGAEAADTLVSSMVTGVFGGDAKRLSIEHCFPRMAAMEREHGSLFKAMKAKKREGGGSPMGPGGTLTSFRDGIGQLPERAAHRLGERLRLNFKVNTIAREGNAYRVTSDTGETIAADHVIVALPVHQTAHAIAALDAQLAAALRTIEHAPIAVVCTGYPHEAVAHDMDGFGFLVPRSEGRRVLGCIWTSSVFPESAPPDCVLLRTMFGGTLDPAALELSDDELIALLEREVHPLLGIGSAPSFVRMVRHRIGIPQYGLDHDTILRAVGDCEAANPGLKFAGNGYTGVSLNDCVVSALGATNAIASPSS